MKQIFRALALTLATTTATTMPVLADVVPLNALSRYLTDLATVETTFTQVNADGSLSTGKLYIKRPGRMRFEYDPPSNALVIAGANTVAIFDPVSDGAPSQYPLRRTPLNLILARDVDLARSGMVQSHSGDETATRVLARDPERPEIGTIELVFSNDPVELRQWVIDDPENGVTTVILGALEPASDLSEFLFSIDFETEQRLGPQN